MQSHFEGEVWGLAIVDSNRFVTSGDDNKIFAWTYGKNMPTGSGTVSNESRKAKRGGASTLSKLPDSKCSRALAYNPSNGHVAVGHNDGTLSIRASVDNLDSIVATKNDSREWIECMAYSPDGSKLAVGSHDNNIYIYDSSSYNLAGTCKAHNSFIVSVDWSSDGAFIRSVCGAHELLFFDGNSYAQDKSGASNTVGTVWATSSAKFGWLVDGIFPKDVDGTHINGVDFSANGELIACADDYGLVNIFRNPCRLGSKPMSFRGHSEHVVRAKFTNGDNNIISVGGFD
mmetsp:Transcript_28423/g.27378  ORF Transcript_28423/g.27378 Transcript_28423/m.27378 type:complete len:287 (-) Transcript_28423:84-944(-)